MNAKETTVCLEEDREQNNIPTARGIQFIRYQSNNTSNLVECLVPAYYASFVVSVAYPLDILGFV